MDKNHLVEEEGEGKSLNFIEQIIEEELAAGKNGGRVHTRFPPEPNGYLHIGHATSICLNFGIAAKYNGKCNLRFDDTNPSKEDVEYIDSIQQDIRWLGFQWEGEPHYASDYFQQLYDWAEKLIVEGKPYLATHADCVCPAPGVYPPDVGSFIELLRCSSGRSPDVICGKPERVMGDMLMKKLGVSPSSVTMVGDRPYTDIRFGNNNLFGTLLVLSGETNAEEAARLPSSDRPSAIAESLNEVVKYL